MKHLNFPLSSEISISPDILMLSIINGRKISGGFQMAPEVYDDGGLLDVCIADQVSWLEIIKLI